MIEYRVYRLDGVTRETSAEWIKAKRDEVIIKRVQRNMGTSIRCEIWRGNKIVKRLGYPPLPPNGKRRKPPPT